MTDREILRLIGKNIRKARLARDYTQKCLAEMLDLNEKTVIYLEQGKHPFKVTTFARIIQCLEVSPNRLLDELSPGNDDNQP